LFELQQWTKQTYQEHPKAMKTPGTGRRSFGTVRTRKCTVGAKDSPGRVRREPDEPDDEAIVPDDFQGDQSSPRSDKNDNRRNEGIRSRYQAKRPFGGVRRIGRLQRWFGAPERWWRRCIPDGVHGATRNGCCESKQLDPKLPAEDTTGQHERYKGKRMNVPEPSTSPSDNLLERS